ncbi:2500_t:CDS:2, partial [Entrophospora sp. SA101]
TSLFDNYQSREIFELSRSLKEAGENVTINQKGLIQSSKRVIIKKILEAMANGIDVSSLFGEVVKGNDSCHIILRGGTHEPNYSAENVKNAVSKLEAAKLTARIMIDCSHGNSQKVFSKQVDVVKDIVEQLKTSPTGFNIMGVMIESNLVEDFNKIIDDHILKQLNNSYDNNYKIVSIGISICGLTDEEGVISLCEIGNLSGWNPVKCVKEKFGNDIKVKVINDSDAALEYVRREWPGVKDLAIIIAGS